MGGACTTMYPTTSEGYLERGDRAGLVGTFSQPVTVGSKGRGEGRDCRRDDLKWSRTINGHLKETRPLRKSRQRLSTLLLPSETARCKTISNLCTGKGLCAETVGWASSFQFAHVPDRFNSLNGSPCTVLIESLAGMLTQRSLFHS